MPGSRKPPFDVAKLTIHELLVLREEADKILRARIKSEKAALLQQVKDFERYEKSMDGADLRKARPPANPAKRTAKSGRRKVAPKFRDPRNGATWAGRGLQPKWLREAIADGRSLEDFRIT